MAEPINAAGWQGPARLDADVCVIGCGAAGLYLATLLAGKGLQVVALEAGPLRPVSGEKCGISASMAAQDYAGASGGRAFGLGGTTSAWGGKLAFPAAGGFPADAAWQAIRAAVSASSAAVLERIAMPAGAADAAAQPITAGMTGLHSWHMGFRQRNFAALFAARAAAEKRLTILVNAPVIKLGMADTAAGEPVIASAFCAAGITVHARRFVICAGAIESTRMLLELERSFDRSPLAGSALLGRRLGDHLSAPIAVVAQPSRGEVIARFGPDFRRGLLRSQRFVETGPESNVPACFSHYVFDDNAPGFTLLRDVMASIQRRRLPRVDPLAALAGLSDLGQIGWQRLVRNRLRISARAQIRLQLDMAQRPSGENRITLGRETDSLGRPLAVIDWRISDADVADFQAAAARHLALWQSAVPRGAFVRHDADAAFVKPFDAYHPVGTTPMGAQGDGVLNGELQVRGMANLYAAATSALPDAGDANPTFTLLCLTHQLAQTLLRAEGR